jgi:hypothetical protein
MNVSISSYAQEHMRTVGIMSPGMVAQALNAPDYVRHLPLSNHLSCFLQVRWADSSRDDDARRSRYYGIVDGQWSELHLEPQDGLTLASVASSKELVFKPRDSRLT